PAGPRGPMPTRRRQDREQGTTLSRLSLAALTCLSATLALCWTGNVEAANWPMWRYDANRTAASPEELPAQLHLQWVRDLPPLKPAWPDQPKMQLDSAYEPIIYHKLLYFGSSLTDSVTALDTETREEKWRFHADGPVPPVQCAILLSPGKACSTSRPTTATSTASGRTRAPWSGSSAALLRIGAFLATNG